ncbi:MAG: hypothetical protein IJU61_05930, partial [Victivallales bacterium]|nr:hypothetical protein [Victivallales bacterium]
MITEKYFIYNFQWMCFGPLKDGMRFRDGFVFRFKLNALPKADDVLFEVPGTLKVTSRNIPNDAAEGGWERAENFRSLPEVDGHCHVIEIEIFVEQPDHPNWQSMKIGLPISLLGDDWKNREIAMAYTKMRLQIFVDGEL